MMPAAGAEARAQTLATLARVRHEMFIDDEIGRLIDQVRSEQGDVAPGESIDADLARVVARDWEKATRVPSELQAEMAHASSVAETAWVEAKQRSDFAMLLPHLRKNVDLTKRYAECFEGFPGFTHAYDPLLDEYEPEMTTDQMREVLTGSARGAGAARSGGDGQRRRAGRGPVRRRIPRGRAARAGRGDDLGAPLPRGLVADRPDRASLRDLDRARRRSAHHPLRRVQPGDGPVQRNARGGARAVRVGRRP